MGAHGVWVSDADIQVLKMRNVGISHNPESNMKTASGVAPIPEYLRAGVSIGLGTDGAASNNDLDMFEAMRIAALLAKLESSGSLDDECAHGARNGYHSRRACAGHGRAHRIARSQGSARISSRSRMSGARQTPMYDPISHLVYVIHGDDVRNTVVNGKVLMRDRNVLTLDADGRDCRSAIVGGEGSSGREAGRGLVVDDREIREIAIALPGIEPVSDDEQVVDREPHIIDGNVRLAS